MTDAANVRVAVTGGVFKNPTAAPTGTSGAPTGADDLGFISADGVEINIPGSGDSTPIKAWQNGTTVRTVRTTSDDLPSWHFTMIETNIATVETYFGITVTDATTEGSFEFTVADRPADSYVVDVVDGAELIRDYIPQGVVSEVGAHTLASGEAIGYEVTVEGQYDATAGYNFKRWATALKTPA